MGDINELAWKEDLRAKDAEIARLKVELCEAHVYTKNQDGTYSYLVPSLENEISRLKAELDDAISTAREYLKESRQKDSEITSLTLLAEGRTMQLTAAEAEAERAYEFSLQLEEVRRDNARLRENNITLRGLLKAGIDENAALKEQVDKAIEWIEASEGSGFISIGGLKKILTEKQK